MIARLRRRRAERSADPAAALDAVADAVARLAALVAAGAAPSVAARAVAEHAHDLATRAAVLQAVAAPPESGAPPVGAAPRIDTGALAWARVRLLIALSSDVGAPLRTVLGEAGVGLRAAADLHRAVAVAVAGPAASARLMLWTPPGALLTAWAFGFDVPAAFLRSPIAPICAASALGLLVTARRWSRALVDAAAVVDHDRGLGVELVAVGIRAGLDPGSAARRARALGGGSPLDADEVELRRTIGFAASAGVPLAGLLTAEAARIRAAELAAAAGRSAALATRLLVPLGALVLPAFLLLAVVPIGLAVVSSTSVSLR